MVIRRKRRQAIVFDGMTDRKVIEDLVTFVLNSQYPVDLIVEKAADTCSTEAVCLGGQIEYLADHAALPMQASIVMGSLTQQMLVRGDHGKGKRAVPSNILMTAEGCGQIACIPCL